MAFADIVSKMKGEITAQTFLDAAAARLALSPANPAPEAAAWVQGLVRGSGMVLLHQDGLWAALDEWLVTLERPGGPGPDRIAARLRAGRDRLDAAEPIPRWGSAPR